MKRFKFQQKLFLLAFLVLPACSAKEARSVAYPPYPASAPPSPAEPPTAMAHDPAVTPALALAHKITADEYARAVETLGRTPT